MPSCGLRKPLNYIVRRGPKKRIVFYKLLFILKLNILDIYTDMENRIEPEYYTFIEENPNKDFVLYLRNHPGREDEVIVKEELIRAFGVCKEVPKERLIIFITKGNKVVEFINRLNDFNSTMYISFIQSKDELSN